MHAEVGRDTSQAATLIAAWLDRHGFAYHEIYRGQGKPPASAYVDDRAVACRPQENPHAFTETLDAVRRLST
ncbi:MAG: hypothetical protein ACOYMN_01430 [Roseimicrobium sp.]